MGRDRVIGRGQHQRAAGRRRAEGQDPVDGPVQGPERAGRGEDPIAAVMSRDDGGREGGRHPGHGRGRLPTIRLRRPPFPHHQPVER